jgi:hypothetical protein
MLTTVPLVSADANEDAKLALMEMIFQKAIVSTTPPPPAPIHSVVTLPTDVGIATLSKYEYRDNNDSALDFLKSLVGMQPSPSSITVFINGVQIASFQPGSRFENMKIHDVCLQYQYGTDRWYECEVPLQ